MAEHGFTGLPGYVGGRGGVLGDVDSDVVVSAFALFNPAIIEMGWNQTKEQGSPPDAAAALAVGLGRWGSRHLRPSRRAGRLCRRGPRRVRRRGADEPGAVRRVAGHAGAR